MNGEKARISVMCRVRDEPGNTRVRYSPDNGLPPESAHRYENGPPESVVTVKLTSSTPQLADVAEL